MIYFDDTPLRHNPGLIQFQVFVINGLNVAVARRVLIKTTQAYELH